VRCQDGPLALSRMLSSFKALAGHKNVSATLSTCCKGMVKLHLSTTLGFGVSGITPWTV